MSEKLVIIDNSDGTFRISWYFPDDCEEGGFLGQSHTDGEGAEPSNIDDWAHWVASRAVKPFVDNQDDYRGFVFEKLSTAKKALKAANLALKLGRNSRPMPAWAVTALEAGWKPPKNWKP
jgi:hypothetical protein